ncbi:MAG: hypothetical protein ACO3UU_06855, partial [Minisyncoccia bacterium]
ALSSDSLNPVGTRFGADLIPYKKSGIYLDYKSKNPFVIYKKSTPYLYLTKDSGIEVLGEFDQSTSRGISFPINKGKINPFDISAIQLWMKYDKDKVPLSQIELFSIDYLGDTIKFYLVADSENGLRGRVFNRRESNNTEFTDLQYYWNGNFVKEPVLTVGEWGVLMVFFTSPINFNSYAGALNVSGPVVYNNLAYYQTNSFSQSQSTIYRTWGEVKEEPPTGYAWQDWDQDNWQEVLVIDSTNIYDIVLPVIYDTYIGTNKTIIDDNDGLVVNSDALGIYAGATWSTFVKTPV